MNLMIFLDEVTEFNGPLMLIPRSHRHGMIDVEAARGNGGWQDNVAADLKYSLDREAVAKLVTEGGITAPKGPRGSVLLFHPNLAHASAPNLVTPGTGRCSSSPIIASPTCPYPRASSRPEFLRQPRHASARRHGRDAGRLTVAPDTQERAAAPCWRKKGIRLGAGFFRNRRRAARVRPRPCPLPRSAFGSCSVSSRRAAPIIWARRSGCGARSMPGRWAAPSTAWSAATRRCARAFPPTRKAALRPETLLPAVIGGVLRRLDLASQPEPRRAAEAAENRALFSRHSTWRSSPLFRALLLTLAIPDEHRLAICVHHLVFDGWSIGLLARELSAGYAARKRRGGPWRPPPLSLGYGDYAAWQRQRSGAPAWGEALAWWENRLRGVPPLELPTDRPRAARVSGRGAGHRFVLAGGVAGRLRALAQREGTTIFSPVLLAAYETLLSKQAAQADFGIGVSVAGRTHRALEELVGMFVNTVVFRADLAGDPTFAGLVRRVRDEALEVLARQETPFEQIVDRLQLERDLSRNPVFQAGLFLQNAPRRRIPPWVRGARARGPRDSRGEIRPLVSLEEVPGGELRGSIEYSTDLSTRRRSRGSAIAT